MDEYHKFYPYYPAKMPEDKVFDKFAGDLAEINLIQKRGVFPEKNVPDRLGCRLLSAKHSSDGANVLMELQREDLVFYMYRNGVHGQYSFSERPSRRVSSWYERQMTDEEVIEQYLDKHISIPLAVISVETYRKPVNAAETARSLGAVLIASAPYGKGGAAVTLEKDGIVFYIAKGSPEEEWFFDADETPYFVRETEIKKSA